MTEISMEEKRAYESFISKVRENYSKEDADLIDLAYRKASAAHIGQTRESGEPYIIHPIAVAEILMGLGMDAQSLIAALLHDVVEDTDVCIDEIGCGFDSDVAALVDGVTKLNKVPLASKEEAQAENIRKMLLAMSEDIRVIIIKLADRLHNMRTLSFVSEQKRRDKALETLEIYAPIAHRLGIRPIKEELEDIAISYLDPIAYNDIKESLEAQSKSRNEFLEKIKARIGERISEIVKGAKIEGRIKSVHGIYRKMYMQNRTFDEIYDIYAVRIIVNTVIDCYNCLGVIHDMFRPIPGRFKDYISTPKPNMYQSLHTTVIGKEGIPFEVQIRTWEMHRTAEYGIAAHWKYKLGLKGKQQFEERLAWIRQLLELQKDSEDVEDIVRTIKTDLVPEEVYVLTPKGDVISLPQGATVIDFAYAIHSAVGNRMIGAKVDGRIVPITHVVKTGEIIEILTSNQTKGPSRDWLKIVKTSEARSKIRQWFKKQNREENIEVGKSELEREFRRSNIRLEEEGMNELIQKIAERYNFQDIQDFYAAIGYGGVSISRILPQIKEEYNKLIKAQSPTPVKLKMKSAASSEGVIVEGIENCLVKLSKCCNPIPGDDIIGFITRGHGVSVHKRDCSNVPYPIESAPEPDRWIPVRWDSDIKEDFNAALLITCLASVSIMADISGALANMHVMIHSLNTRETKDGRYLVTVTVTVKSLEHLRSVMSRLDKINGVFNVERSGL
ncbi:MAG TPA: bifunctional (p)ppGpp synthetase/guanosine-3',5'-bis(diphosphate) 3'-pyrophosphohydrolase [Clostridiales bacterium]|nr:bifunctional (p)ppGpp synthetase/guanosine-3',5'-bis(diphosphate) 3'-pyrophosphohydrolase [Clostridiales bacterium]HQA04822.1 bifunctional (p)ppGpp synthetase/guanosine-3',5'-bis(diphosphate) 3'-pyrophosphohydrolase [Clostridiales bacterium]